MKRISPEEIKRLSSIRAMFPEDWCQAQLEDCERQAENMVEVTPEEAIYIIKVIKIVKLPTIVAAGSIVAKLKPIAERKDGN